MPQIRPNIQNMVKGRSAHNSATFNCGDVVANSLAGWPIENVRDLAQSLGIDPTAYDHLNNGHQRMILGQRFRKLVKTQNQAHGSDPSLPTGEAWFAEKAQDYAPEEVEEVEEVEETAPVEAA